MSRRTDDVRDEHGSCPPGFAECEIGFVADRTAIRATHERPSTAMRIVERSCVLTLILWMRARGELFCGLV